MEWLVVGSGECLAGFQAPLIVTKARHDGAASRRSRSVPPRLERRSAALGGWRRELLRAIPAHAPLPRRLHA